MQDTNAYHPFLEGWRTIDKLLAFIFIVLTPTMMIISIVNLQSLIENSYQPVFINSPWKSWIISLIAPASSVCIKLLPMVFSHRQTKLLYKKALYLLTAFVIVVWIVLFSMTFDGFSIPDVGSLARLDAVETGAQDTRLYSFIQLMAEILISACLFMGLEMLLDKYQPEKEKPNPERQTLTEKIKHQKRARAEAVDNLERETERHANLVNARQSFIDHWLDTLTLAKARHAAISKFFGE